MHINVNKKFPMNYYGWIMHINVGKKFPRELLCLSYARQL